MKNEAVHPTLIEVRAILEEAKVKFDKWYDKHIPKGDEDNGLDKGNAREVSDNLDSAIVDLNMVIGSDIVRRKVFNEAGVKL